MHGLGLNGLGRPRYSIGEASRSTRINQSTLRFWEKEFPRYLKPHKSAGNQRYYTPENMEVISEINHLLNVEKYTIAGANQRMAKHRATQRSFKDVLTSAVEDVQSGKTVKETVKKYTDYDALFLPVVAGTIVWQVISLVGEYLKNRY